MITLYEHGVISQDSVFWADRNLHPEALRQERLRTSFKDCIWGIGYLHGAGVVHGDAEAKNLAHDGRQVRFIDLESAQLLPRSDKHHLLNDPDSARRKHQDITTFIETSLQVEENRPEILRALSSKDLALFYRKGFKKGSADAEIVSPRTPASESNEYFDTIVNQITNRLHAQ